MKRRLVHEVNNLDCPVQLIQTGVDSFTVAYGLDVTKGLNYQQAAASYGECIMHSATCAGELDNPYEGD